MSARATFRAIGYLLLVAASLLPLPASATVSLGAWIQHSPDDISGFLTLTGNDATVTPSMPFSVTIEGVSYSTVTISTNGWLEFGGNTEGSSHPGNLCLPTATHTNPFLAAYWDDLNPFGTSIRYGTVGTSPHRTFVVDYEVDLTSGSEGSDDLRFQVQVHETSHLINVRYRDQQSATNGIAATIGFQRAGGTSAQALTCNGKVLDDNESDEGWSVDASRSGLLTLAAFMAHSPDDITGFTTLSGNDAIAAVTLPFSITVEGVSYSNATIGTNGLIQLGTTTGANPGANTALPSASFPNPTIFYFWDDLQTEGNNIRYGTVGTSPNRTFIVDFQENLAASSGDKVNGQVQIHEGSSLINIKYRNTLSNPANGQTATIGFQGAGGASAAAYPLTFNGKVLDDNRPDEGWSVHPKSTGSMSLHAFMEHSPDDIGGFTTLSGNDSIAGVTLPFSVSIDGVSYSTVTIGSNGLIQFGTTTGANPTANASLPSSSFPNPTIFYFWDDLQTEGGHIRYGAVGSSPHRTFIVDFQENLVASSGNKVNGQVQIHEGSNLFNVQYRSTLSAAANGQSATIGFQSAGGASATAYPLTFNGKILDDNLPDAGWSISPLPICGNGITETKEQCDAGVANGTLASCCSATCGFKTNGTACTDDGNGCTNDQCNGASATCLHPNNTAPCTDGLFCNGTDTCSGGACGVHTGDPCAGADGDANCAESCDETADNCLAADPNGSACAGNGVGECSGADTCQAGACSNNDVTAGTACTDTAPPSSGDCLDAQCNGAGICDQGFVSEVNGSSCNDAVFCNGADTCNAGSCSSHAGDPCPGPDGDGNCAESCNESADDCSAADTNGSPCTGNGSGECTGADACTAGVCDNNDTTAGTPCVDTAPPASGDCKVAQCDGAGTCDQGFANESDGTSCDDALFCNGTDTCTTGACSTHGGDPCPGADGDVNCAESCDEANDDCNGSDPDGTTCRPGVDDCDTTETCTSGSCPADGFEPSGTGCGSASDTDCDNPDTCDGAGTCAVNNEVGGTPCTDDGETCTTDTCDGLGGCEHPAGNAGAECRAGAGACDIAELCDGSTPTCPADVFQPNTVECRSVTVGDVCDEPESCTGSSASCPADSVSANSEECRPSQGVCDTADFCDGVNKQCPADAKEPMTTECRSSAGICDAAESCDGSSDACPADQFQPSTVSCRATSTGELCDEEELCTGAGPTCPPDGVKANGTVCRAGVDVCDAEETCDGASVLCPGDSLEPSGTPCRPAAGSCDAAETCDGAGTSCPVDAFQASGTACGSNANSDCDNPDTCNGSGTCLVNNEPNGSACDDSNACTGGEACQTGVCSGGADLCPDLDHYKCYQGKDLKNPKFVKQIGVETDDQIIADELVDVKKLKFICTPVDKNGEGINAPTQHLACYQLKAPKFAVRPKVEVSTQFQTSQFELKKGKLLCLPATKTVLP